MKKIILSAFAISALSLVSCNTDFERDVNNMTVSTGKADFSKFVSVGNSLTSGFRDGALSLDGQNESFPTMIAKQMGLDGICITDHESNGLKEIAQEYSKKTNCNTFKSL